MSEIQRIPPAQSPAERTGEARPAGERRQRPRGKPRAPKARQPRELADPDPAGGTPAEQKPGGEKPASEKPGTNIDLQA